MTVSDEEVEKAWKDACKSAGGAKAFKKTLKTYGYTEDTYKDSLKESLAQQKLKDAVAPTSKPKDSEIVDKGGELIPAHIALLLLGTGVLGVLLNGVLKAQLTGVDLVQALLRLCLGGGLVLIRCVGINLDQDVRRAAGVVVAGQVFVDVVDNLAVLGLARGLG